jgi:hypothetical protein
MRWWLKRRLSIYVTPLGYYTIIYLPAYIVQNHEINAVSISWACNLSIWRKHCSKGLLLISSANICGIRSIFIFPNAKLLILRFEVFMAWKYRLLQPRTPRTTTYFVLFFSSWTDISWGKCLTRWAGEISRLCEDCMCSCTRLLLEQEELAASGTSFYDPYRII